MSSKKNSEKSPPAQFEQEGADTVQEDTVLEAADTTVQALDQARAEVAALKEELEGARARNEELLNLRLREQAEFDNYKKRRLAEQERHEKMALKSLMTDLIDVDSNFRHALNGGEADFAAYKKGVEMIAGQLAALLERNGVVRMDALGQPFDHDLHEAMLQVDEGDHPGLKVVAVMREGYIMHDQVLRLAGVKVARGSGEEGGDVPPEEQ